MMNLVLEDIHQLPVVALFLYSARTDQKDGLCQRKIARWRMRCSKQRQRQSLRVGLLISIFVFLVAAGHRIDGRTGRLDRDFRSLDSDCRGSTHHRAWSTIVSACSRRTSVTRDETAECEAQTLVCVGVDGIGVGKVSGEDVQVHGVVSSHWDALLYAPLTCCREEIFR